ncbi:unnamed protein product [Calypogeia fissa]
MLSASPIVRGIQRHLQRAAARRLPEVLAENACRALVPTENQSDQSSDDSEEEEYHPDLEEETNATEDEEEEMDANDNEEEEMEGEASGEASAEELHVDVGEEEVTVVLDSQQNKGFLEPIMSRNGKRQLQNVTTKMNRKRVMLWMNAEVERCNNTKDICAKAVQEFPSIFHIYGNDNHVYKANIQNASRWWKAKETFLQKVGK